MRSEDLGKHRVYTHFPKDRNCEICQRTKITRAPCRRRNGGAVPRAEKFGDFLQQITKFSVKVVNLETIIEMQSWCRTWPPNGSSRIRAKQKLVSKPKGACNSSWSRSRKPRVIYTDNSLEFGQACEDLSWNHCTSAPHRSETNGIAERAIRRVKEGTSAVLLQSGLDENWWADSMGCDTHLRNIHDLVSDGKTPYEWRFGELLKDQTFRLVHWLSVTLSLRPVKNPSIWKESLTWIVPWIRFVRGWIWKGDIMLQTLRSWKRWTHQKSTQKDSMQRKQHFPNIMEN